MAFKSMMEDIKTGKDNVSFVLVFKLSRFGRNAADVLNSLQTMQDYGVNLICVEDGIDSSKEAGRLMISVLSAVAEIERENIRVQTMEGRMQKAREGRWNGGFAPYGYSLEDGKLVINEEAVAIRMIYKQYINTDLGANGIAKYLENHGIHKIARQNGKNPLFDASLIRKIIQNPVYCGKIAYGRRRTEKVHGTRNDYRQVYKDDYLLVDGIHEALIPEDIWEQAQIKVAAQAKKYEKVNSPNGQKIHLLSGLLKCPVCGASMYGNKAIKSRKDGTRYNDYFYYGRKHHNMTREHKCDYKKQISEDKLDKAVIEVLSKLVSNKKFAGLIRSKIDMEVDTTALDQEIAALEKDLRQCYLNKDAILADLDNLNYEDKHYGRRKTDLENRLNRVYDKIEEAENVLVEAKAKKRSIMADKVCGDNIYDTLIYFDKMNVVMEEADRREFLTHLIEMVEIYEEEQPNGQWLKSITFKLPIIPHDMEISLDNGSQIETQDVSGNEAEIQDVSGNAATEQEIVSEGAAQTPVLYAAGANETVYTATELGNPYYKTGNTTVAISGTKYEVTFDTTEQYKDVCFNLDKAYNVEDIESITFNLTSQTGSLNFFIRDQESGNKIGNFYANTGKTSYALGMQNTAEGVTTGTFDQIGLQSGGTGCGLEVLESIVIKVKASTSEEANQAKAVDEGNTGIVLTASSENLSYNYILRPPIPKMGFAP